MVAMTRRHVARLACVVAVCGLLAGLPAGCKQPDTGSSHEALNGTVEALHTDTFELTAMLDDHRAERAKPATVACLFTKDTEVYVNDRFASFDAIAIRDTIELVGYFEPNNPRGERFVVSFANITRAEPPPAEPDLPRPTQPSTQPKE